MHDDGKPIIEFDLVPGGKLDLFVKDFRDDRRWHNNDLRAKSFPDSALAHGILFATRCMPALESREKVSVMGVQETYLKEGWMLGFSFWHGVLDGQG